MTMKRWAVKPGEYAGSIPALLAHAGLTQAPPGQDAVEFAAVTVWGEIRDDLAACATVAPGVTLAEVRPLAPLWPPAARTWLAAWPTPG